MLDAKPIPRVLSRHNLLIGGERECVLVSALICGGVALASMTLVAFITCAIDGSSPRAAGYRKPTQWRPRS
jgi:type IV secretory pathway TrbD component